jgi:hypothetical protein
VSSQQLVARVEFPGELGIRQPKQRALRMQASLLPRIPRGFPDASYLCQNLVAPWIIEELTALWRVTQLCDNCARKPSMTILALG